MTIEIDDYRTYHACHSHITPMLSGYTGSQYFERNTLRGIVRNSSRPRSPMLAAGNNATFARTRCCLEYNVRWVRYYFAVVRVFCTASLEGARARRLSSDVACYCAKDAYDHFPSSVFLLFAWTMNPFPARQGFSSMNAQQQQPQQQQQQQQRPGYVGTGQAGGGQRQQQFQQFQQGFAPQVESADSF